MTSQQQKTSFTILLMYTAIFGSTLIYLIIAFFLSRTGFKPSSHQGLGQMLMGIFMALSLIDVMLILWLKRRSFTEEISSIQPGEPLRKFVISRSVVLFALSEVPAILGLVVYFLTGNFIMQLIFWLLSVIAFLIARPSKEILQRADSV